MTLDELQAQVAQLTTLLQQQQQNTTGRTPEIRRPLTNLLDPPPSATVAKPNFFFEGRHLPQAPYVYRPFPALRYRVMDGVVEERAIRSQAELDALGPEWQIGEPDVAPLSPRDELEEALASLTPEERAAVLAESQVQRRATLTAKLAALHPSDVPAVSDASAAPRKRGRPRKM